jgi:hypothetical protein
MEDSRIGAHDIVLSGGNPIFKNAVKCGGIELSGVIEIGANSLYIMESSGNLANFLVFINLLGGFISPLCFQEVIGRFLHF